MNRQAANYIESVGDPMPRPWQDKRHNKIWLYIVGGIFLVILALFWLINGTSLEEATISIKEQHKHNHIIQSNIYLTYAHNGDFNFAENGEVRYVMPKNFWQRFIAPATCQMFCKNYYDQDEIIKLDTLTSLDLSKYGAPEGWNKDSSKVITNNKEYFRYSDLSIDAKIKSSLIFPRFIPYKLDTNVVYADAYRYSERKKSIKKDILTCSTKEHLYGKHIINQWIISESDQTVKIENGEQKIHTQEIGQKEIHIFGDASINSQQIDIFRIARRLPRITNRTCCNLYIKKIEFPCDSNCRFILSFASPMSFDKLSIKPDEERPNELIYSSPEKILQLKESGLYIFARDVSMNNQEMLNFLLATFLGILISYFVEFSKRLYTRRMDISYAKRNKAVEDEQSRKQEE